MREPVPFRSRSGLAAAVCLLMSSVLLTFRPVAAAPVHPWIDDGSRGLPAYAPDRVIVKFEPDAAMGMLGRGGRTIAPGLARAIGKAHVKHARPLFADLWSAPGGGPPVRAADKAQAVRARFPLRAARAPAPGRIPDLENILVLELDTGASVDSALTELRRCAEVAWAEPDGLAHVCLEPNDPFYSSTGLWGQPYWDMWGLHAIHAAEAWDITTGSDSVVIAVIDTGLDYNHPDIADRVWANTDEIPGNGIDDDGNGFVDDVRGWDFAYGDNDPMDYYGHGTHVSGTIGATANNGEYIAGVCWRGRIMPVKGLNDAGGGPDSDLALAMRYAADNGADIMNNSWGALPYAEELFKDTVDYCYGLGCIVVAAAGNDGCDVRMQTPANLPNVVCVAATGPGDAYWGFNHGERVDVSAPGLDILSLRSSLTSRPPIAPGLMLDSGTSMAAPHVSGALALLVAAHPDWSSAQIVSQLDDSADPIVDLLNPHYAGRLGLGRLDVQAALSAAPSGDRRIALLSRTVDDSLSNGDGCFEPGERLRVSVALKHFINNSPDVTATFSSADPYVVPVSDDITNFGAISGWQAVNNAAAPFVLDIDPGCPRFHYLPLNLAVTADGGSSWNWQIRVPVSMELPGWPVLADTNWTQPVLADADLDGQPEVVVGNGEIRVFEGDGQKGPPFGVTQIAPCVGDIDGDSSPELVWASWSGQELRACHADPYAPPLPGFPIPLESGWQPDSVSLADLDGSPGLEIVVLNHKYPGSESRVEVYRHDGTPLPGWPSPSFGAAEWWGCTRDLVRAAVGDINGDESPEVVAIEDGEVDDRAWAWRADGEVLPGFPVGLPMPLPGGLYGRGRGPALGDVDGDGAAEIVLSLNGRLSAFRGDGAALAGWPQPGRAIALGDANEDGRLEIIAGDATQAGIRVYRWDGLLLSDWDTQDNVDTEPAVADIDGDGHPEVIARDSDNRIYAWRSDGTLLPEFPLDVGDYTEPFSYAEASTVAVGDINGDGHTELVTGAGLYDPITSPQYHSVHAFALPWAFNADLAPWPMRGANPRNDGVCATTPPNTPAGSQVEVDLPEDIHVCFCSVTTAGNTTVTTSTTPPASPVTGFNFLGTYYEIATTAGYTGPITIQFPFDPATVPPDKTSELKVFHLQDSAWCNVTVSVDAVNHVVVAQVLSLSWFGIGYPRYDFVGFLQPINMPPDVMSVFKKKSTVPVKFRLLDAGQPVGDVRATIWVQKVANGVPAGVNEPVYSTQADEGNAFRYDEASGQYIFNLSTNQWSSGVYRMHASIMAGLMDRWVDIAVK